MFMNYMDYTDDYCMNAFSTGQVTYMRKILTTSRAQLITPGRTKCPSETIINPPASCTDGIKNGDETGVDCGGSCTPCQTTSGADAGIASLSYTIEAQQCNQVVRFKAKLTNFGTANLSAVMIEVRSASGKLLTYNWSGLLAAKASVNVSLPVINLPAGNHQVTGITKNPNGKADTNPANDQSSVNVKVNGSSQLRLVIKPDDYGADISWKIKDAQGKVVASGGGYPDFNKSIITESICLTQGCYKLIMSDSYGDGICCDYGKGWYELRDAAGKVLLDSDGYYGYSETQNFCLDANNILSRQEMQREPRIAQSKRRDISKATGQSVKN
ncbi:MAG: hypothetical protein IPL46_15025 [Saprospiraceae bacterium]|nr:hypothetical protein [Saprospiraceae bacterium]